MLVFWLVGSQGSVREFCGLDLLACLTYTAINPAWDLITFEEITNLTSSVPDCVQDLILSSTSHHTSS